jgi:hypothetical protein
MDIKLMGKKFIMKMWIKLRKDEGRKAKIQE